MNIRKQSLPTVKRKLTPLFLLSKVKKNKQIVSINQSVLALIQNQQRKINNRYKVLNQSNKRINTDIIQRQDQCLYKQTVTENEKDVYRRSSLTKIQQILRKQQKNKSDSQYNSAQKYKNKYYTPYQNLKVQKRKIQVKLYTQEQQKKSLSEVKRLKPNTTFYISKKQSIKVNTQASTNTNIENTDTPDNLINGQLQYPTKLLSHFTNLCKIQQILQNKISQKQIISIIKNYILSQQADPSQLQTIYISPNINTQIKKVLFFQKILIILIVDLIINRKFKITQVFIKSSIKSLCQFYLYIFVDLLKQNKIKIDQLAQSNYTVRKLKQFQRQQSNTRKFIYLRQYIQNKLHTCLKYSRHLQQFYKLNNRNISTYNSNLFYFRLLQFYSLTLLAQNWLNWDIDFLQVCPSPYLHNQPNKKYTLCLDLDQTLIHYKINNNNVYKGQFLIRPFMFQFLQRMSHIFQLGIFTCSMPEYADLIINHMKYIQFRLYRHHTVKIKGQHLKDLSRLGRDLKYVILVDNLEHNFRLQKNNGVHVRSWYGDKNDDILKQIAEQLEILIATQPQDIRVAKFQRKFL